MGDQWAQGFRERTERWHDLAKQHHEPDELIVVNASGGLGWRRAGWLLRAPFLGELLSLLWVKDVLYDVSTSHRRQGLAGRFDRAAREGYGLRGALVHIPQSPFDVARAFVEPERAARWPDRARRARRVLAELGESTDADRLEQAKNSASVPTTLKAIGADRSARLMHHAYVLAMCNLHVVLDYPLLQIPSLERFAKMVDN